MKKRRFALFILSLLFTGFIAVFPTNMAKAQEMATVTGIGFSSFPAKTTFTTGEKLDLTGMTVLAMYSDGTSAVITDYTIDGYNNNQVGTQMITIGYQGCTAVVSITVVPAKVSGITISSHTDTGYTLTWNSIPDVSYYDIYSYDNITGTSSYLASSTVNSYSFTDIPGNVRYYKILAVKDMNGVKYSGEYSDAFAAATPPGKVEGLSVITTTDTTVNLTWGGVSGATGYVIYRSKGTTSSYSYAGSTTSTVYTDMNLSSGTTYSYKVYAYIVNETIVGEASAAVDTSTAPGKVSLRLKAGDKKVRLTWSKATGATTYTIYSVDAAGVSTLLTTVTGESNCTYIAEGLITGVTYNFNIQASRTYNGLNYTGSPSMTSTITVTELPGTSVTAKYFTDELAFLGSTAYNKIPFFQENVNYSSSYVIPGLITTNVGGFLSTTMCPQGIAFADNYLFLTAYDLSDQENSVIYVLDKNTKTLLTTLVLPTDAHVGGICYDGKYLWLTTGSKASCFPITDVYAAVAAGTPYTNITFFSVCKLGFAASYMTYYDDMLWVGTYDELKTTYMYSYSVDDYDTSVGLTKVYSMKMPTRVQGIAFTGDGYLILSRSCQLYKGLRGYMRRIDVYQPDLSDTEMMSKSLGTCLNYVYTPSMNEGIAVDGTTLYVNFESGAFENASYKVDRVCAFDLEAILKDVKLANK